MPMGPEFKRQRPVTEIACGHSSGVNTQSPCRRFPKSPRACAGADRRFVRFLEIGRGARPTRRHARSHFLEPLRFTAPYAVPA